MKSNIENEVKKEIINNLNARIGSDINDFATANEIENELKIKATYLESCLHTAGNKVPTKLSSTIEKAERNSKQVDAIRNKMGVLVKKVDRFYTKTQPLMTEFDKRFSAINKLEGVLAYFQSYTRVDELSNQMKQCKDDEQLVTLYLEMKELCNNSNPRTHKGIYIKQYTNYWHNFLKDTLTRHYEDVLKILKWPFISAAEIPPPPKEVMNKFYNLTRYLFLIKESQDVEDSVSWDVNQEKPSLPLKVLLKPLKKRFIFHFTGSRQTARIDRPEWFLTQILTWIKDHQNFIKSHVQPIAEKLDMNQIDTVMEFNVALIDLATERLHTILAMYHTQGSKGETIDMDAAFAHAVDETLGFQKELSNIMANDTKIILSVITKADNFVRWLAVEKKYALAKMDETLDNEQWIEAVAAGVGSAVGAVVWVPRGAEWFISLLKTIEDRYAILPQPGHRLQFLELQLELIEEWRIRLTQLLNAATATLNSESFLVAGPHPLIAVINAAHHTMTVLMQWTHALHYLQLHYYRRQFEKFTQQQHKDQENSFSTSIKGKGESEGDTSKQSYKDEDVYESISLSEIEARAKQMALKDMTNHVMGTSQYNKTAPIVNVVGANTPNDEVQEDGGVFGDAPALLGHLRDEALAALSVHIMYEFKATMHDYKRQKWYAMPQQEELALSVSTPLCAPLAALCARLAAVTAGLAPRLAAPLRATLTAAVDDYLLEELALMTWFNTGGTMQFTYDVKKILLPTFAPPNKVASKLNLMPKLHEVCKLLNMDYDEARRLRSQLSKESNEALDSLKKLQITHIPPTQALCVLSRRTDLTESVSQTSVMELF